MILRKTQIRQANPSDKGILKKFQKQMAWETEKLELDEDQLDKGLEAILNDASKGNYFVAEEGGNVIACLMVTPEWSDWRNGIVWWIQSVFVDEDYRRKGIYRQLYNHIQDWVKSNEDYKGIRLYVEKDNKTAQQVYSALGMDGEHYKLFEWMKP
ncbi:MAG: GNAT family N-acetyltransferase [Candidatus Cyclobacteriaceae bacterium M2_1C_046]